jgi:arsenate reductase-like glutaredoxin family protein
MPTFSTSNREYLSKTNFDRNNCVVSGKIYLLPYCNVQRNAYNWFCGQDKQTGEASMNITTLSTTLLQEMMGTEATPLEARIMMGILGREGVIDTDDISDRDWLAYLSEAAQTAKRMQEAMDQEAMDQEERDQS